MGLLILATHVLTEGSFSQLTTAAGTTMYVICDFGYQLRTMNDQSHVWWMVLGIMMYLSVTLVSGIPMM